MCQTMLKIVINIKFAVSRDRPFFILGGWGGCKLLFFSSTSPLLSSPPPPPHEIKGPSLKNGLKIDFCVNVFYLSQSSAKVFFLLSRTFFSQLFGVQIVIFLPSLIKKFLLKNSSTPPPLPHEINGPSLKTKYKIKCYNIY